MGEAREKVVLAFSGGLDTSFCVPYLIDHGYDVITLFVDTGGVSDQEREYIQARARQVGAVEHITIDASAELWEEFVVPLVQFGGEYQDQYPMLCSDRYVIVRKSLELCKARGTKNFAHGCTGMGNDQVRFDQTVRSLGNFNILSPIRDIQHEHKALRQYEQDYLKERGFDVRSTTSKYSVNENILGVTMSGSEIDKYEAPDDEATWKMCAHPTKWPRTQLRVRIGFERGVPVTVDGETMDGPALLKKCNTLFGAYGVGRRIYSSDTTIGLKARIVFECPGIAALMHAHRGLEEAILTSWQASFKPTAADAWVKLVYKGFFYEPLKADLEAFLRSTQQFVTGQVTLETWGGSLMAVAIDSPHILERPGASYAQSADWTVTEAMGFIKLFGQSSTISAMINPTHQL